ncbi:hypothetical protein ACQI4L_27685 [Mycolicibacterium litorale]|uniref:hypothetical protein n=1 Tax=Mycolicibacterium litorale TaxID=758802 RepID=UPI003CFA00B8
MATAPSPLPDVGGESSSGDVGSSLDAALREAVETLESPAYQDGNPAFSPLTARDWIVIAAVYVAIPVLFALVVGAA